MTPRDSLVRRMGGAGRNRLIRTNPNQPSPRCRCPSPSVSIAVSCGYGREYPPYGAFPKIRGATYTWIPNHLGDTEGRASPRSFLAALKEAARDTDERYPDHDRALHYDSIKQGVQKASGIRVREIREDYPWVHRALEPLGGLSVPCAFGDIEERWGEKDVIARLKCEAANDEVKLPPPQIDRGAVGVREDLEALRIFHRMFDGRVQIPDVFRVGYGLLRKGGVKPVR